MNWPWVGARNIPASKEVARARCVVSASSSAVCSFAHMSRGDAFSGPATVSTIAAAMDFCGRQCPVTANKSQTWAEARRSHWPSTTDREPLAEFVQLRLLACGDRGVQHLLEHNGGLLVPPRGPVQRRGARRLQERRERLRLGRLGRGSHLLGRVLEPGL